MIEPEDTPAQQQPFTLPIGEHNDNATIEVPLAQPGAPAAAQNEAPTPLDIEQEIIPVGHSEPEEAQDQITQDTQPGPVHINVEDLLTLRIASDPQVSPDGTQIAFTLMHCDGKQNTTSSSIWLVDSHDGKAVSMRQLSSGEYNDTQPRWSPDGQTLAILSDRNGSTQIYLLSMHGGEAQQVSMLPQDVTEYSWRPDSSSLLAHSSWKPEYDQSTITTKGVSVYKRLDAQWDSIGYKQGRYQQLWLLPRQGQALRLTSEPVDLVQSCWSPDGNQVVFCANRRSDPDLSVSMALWVLTVTTGHMYRLTPEEGLAQVPSWSPDGHSIAYLYTADQTESANYAPWIAAADGSSPPHEAIPGASKLNCQNWIIDELRSEWLVRPLWSSDSQSLLVAVQEHGQVHLNRLNLTTQQVDQLTRGNGRYLSPNSSKDGQTIAFVRADWFTPGDIWSMDYSGHNLRKLTGINDELLRNRQLIRPRRIFWQSHDGLKIEGWLYFPPQATKAPLILAPHGGPSLAWGDAYVHEFQVLAGRGYAVLAPNPRGSAGYGEDFSRKALNDWGGDDWRDLQAGIDHVIASEPIDEQRLGIGGLSYGGYMTNWAITQTQRFKAAVSRNSISSISTASLLSDQTIWFNLSLTDEALRQERSALTHVEHITTPLLLLHAENDLRCPFSEALQLFVSLRKRKQTVELVRYASVSHLLDWPGVGTPQQRVDRLRRTLEWFERYV